MITQPYIGLRPFKQHEHEIFFGREEHVDELIHLLSKTNFIAVVSEAYCGKTSLVHCGLETNLLNETETQWHIVNFQPHSNPFSQLTTSLLKTKFLKGDNLNLQQLLNHPPLPENHKLLLVCDQFEDLFHLWQQDKSTAEDFVRLLIPNTQSHLDKLGIKNNIYVIITLRSNYLDKVSLFPELDKRIRTNIYLVPHLNKLQLKAAIIKPILFIEHQNNKNNKNNKNNNISTKNHPTDQEEYFKNDEQIESMFSKIERNERFSKDSKINHKKEHHKQKPIIENIEAKLVDFLLKNMSDNRDQLPLLQHLLMRIWEISLIGKEHPLTMKTYKKIRIENFSEILPKHLEETYDALKENQKVIAKKLFLQLIKIKNDNPLSLLAVSVKITDIAKLEQLSVKDIIKVIEIFRKPERGFLSPATPEELNAETFIKISHEFILRHGSKLKDWKEAEKKTNKNHQALNDYAYQHDKNKGPLLKEHQQHKNELWQWSELENSITQDSAKHYGCNFDLIERYLLKSKNLFAYFHKYYPLQMYGSLLISSLLIMGAILLPNQKKPIVLIKENALTLLYKAEKELILKKEAFYLEKKCNEATLDEPDNTDSWFHCGFWMMYQGKLEKAEVAYRKSKSLDADNTDAALQLAKILIIKKEFDEAEFILNTLLAKDSTNKDILYQLGEILSHEDSLKKSKNRQLTLAIHYYHAALKISPKEDKILSHLGRTFGLLGNHEQAFNHLKKAVEINPKSVDNWYNLGNEYIKNSQIKLGIDAFIKLVEINPNNLKYWWFLGHIYMKDADPEAATKAFTKALSLKPQNDESLRNLGLALLKKGSLIQATEAFKNAVIINKNNDINHRYLGDVWMKRNKLNKALKSYNTAQKINASKINLIRTGHALTKLKQFKKANNLYKQAAVIKESDWK